jgi:hypothetical protein
VELGRSDEPIIPPRPQAAKYFPLYSSIFGFGSAFSSIADIFIIAQLLNSLSYRVGFTAETDQYNSCKLLAPGKSIEQKQRAERRLFS